MPAPTTCLTNTVWPRERVLFLLAGTATLLSAALSAAVSPMFLLMTAAIGLNQLLLVATGRCPASIVVDRLLSRRPARPAPPRPAPGRGSQTRRRHQLTESAEERASAGPRRASATRQAQKGMREWWASSR